MLEERTSFVRRLVHGWNAFREKDQQILSRRDIGSGYSTRPDRVPIRVGQEKSIISTVITRIGIDVASLNFRHAQLDENKRYIDDRDSGLNYCLEVEANIDQTSSAFIQDIAESMCQEGVIAIMPEETSLNPNATAGFDIKSMRVGKIIEWYPEHVKIRVYDKRDGNKKEIILPKRFVSIVQNPLYDVMNEPNSTMKRLAHKINLLDYVDDKNGSGKLDLVVHLPYGAKTEVQQNSVKRRRKDLENQLKDDNDFGIVYLDAAEKVTQLNRPIENHLREQIQDLTSMLYSQLGMNQAVIDGTADEATMLNYYSRTVEPIAKAICDEMNRKFLSKTARSKRQKVVYFRDLMKYATLDSIVNAGRDFTSSEILTPNEVRSWIGMKPMADPNADQLRNRYINASSPTSSDTGNPIVEEDKVNQNVDLKAIGQKRISEL